jgi:hypothetical protein
MLRQPGRVEPELVLSLNTSGCMQSWNMPLSQAVVIERGALKRATGLQIYNAKAMRHNKHMSLRLASQLMMLYALVG